MGLGCDNLLVGKGLREPSERSGLKDLLSGIGQMERIEGTFGEVGLEGPAVWYWPNGKKRMEGEFRRGVVHGRATYYLDNGTRFTGLFRKGVPQGGAVVIGEDGR